MSDITIAAEFGLAEMRAVSDAGIPGRMIVHRMHFEANARDALLWKGKETAAVFAAIEGKIYPKYLPDVKAGRLTSREATNKLNHEACGEFARILQERGLGVYYSRAVVDIGGK